MSFEFDVIYYVSVFTPFISIFYIGSNTPLIKAHELEAAQMHSRPISRNSLTLLINSLETSSRRSGQLLPRLGQ